jgi:hypothetical protein
MEFSSISPTPPAYRSQNRKKLLSLVLDGIFLSRFNSPSSQIRETHATPHSTAQKTPGDAHKKISYMPGLGYGTSGLVTGCVAF